jgi:hypothetical protein
MGIKEKCKNHKKLHQFYSKISVHLKRDHITTHYSRKEEFQAVHMSTTKEIQWLNTIQ